MRIFGGKFRSTVHAPNQPDTVNIEDWRSLQLDIQVCTPILPPVLVADIKAFQKQDSVHAIEDALARISHLRPVQLDPPGFSEARQQVKIEVLPPILVLQLKRFLYDVAADGIVKINKYVQFAPELEIPLGTILSFSPMLTKAKNRSWLGRPRNHGTRCRETRGAGALQALWSALPPRGVR